MSILPQQFSVDKQVLIAPPINLTMQPKSPVLDQVEPEDTNRNNASSEFARLPEGAVKIPIPELVRTNCFLFFTIVISKFDDASLHCLFCDLNDIIWRICEIHLKFFQFFFK